MVGKSMYNRFLHMRLKRCEEINAKKGIRLTRLIIRFQKTDCVLH